MRGLAFLIVAAGLAGCVHAPPAGRHEIVGYYPGWKGAIEVDASLLTVVNYAFLDVGADGAVVLVDPATDRENFARLAALRSRNPHLKLCASVGGWTRSSGFSNMAARASARERFVASSVEFLRRYGFDGIDIDWEYPGEIGIACAPRSTCDRPEDKGNFVVLARELRAALDAAGAADGKHYLATVAAGADRKFLYDGPSAAWMVQLAASLDWVNLMTYDYHGTWEMRAGMLAPLYDDGADPAGTNVNRSVALYLEAGVPARSLTLGIPFYAKGWSGCEPGPNGDGLYQPCAASIDEPADSTRDYKRYWSAAARVPYRYDAASRTFITYDDEESIRAKVAYLRQRGLRGAMYWEIAVDRDRRLARTVSQGLPH